MHRRTVLFAALALSAPAFAQTTPAQTTPAQTTPKRIRGTIRSLEGNVLAVQTNDGETVRVNLAPNYTVGAIVQTTMDQVKPGTMLGIVGFGPPKQQRAAVISILPSTANELQIPWDTQPGSVMTNGPVVSEVTGADGRVLHVTVKGEPVDVTIPANVIVQASEPGTPAMLTPGAHVLIFAQQAADGTVTAPRVNVGKDGFKPAS